MNRRSKPMLTMGPLGAKSAGLPHYISRHDFSDVQATRWCNASMPNMTEQQLQQVNPKGSPRPGSDDHRRFQSKGV